MRNLLLAIAGTALMLTPVNTFAQSDTAGSSNATGLKGPPNANGYDGQASKATNDGGANGGNDASSAQKMKGSPNANGYRK